METDSVRLSAPESSREGAEQHRFATELDIPWVRVLRNEVTFTIRTVLDKTEWVSGRLSPSGARGHSGSRWW